MINDICVSLSLTVEPSGSPDYQTAEALIITFIVNNHLDESANKMAETWEKAFLEHLDHYNSSKINITYSAEVQYSCACTTGGESFNKINVCLSSFKMAGQPWLPCQGSHRPLVRFDCTVPITYSCKCG